MKSRQELIQQIIDACNDVHSLSCPDVITFDASHLSDVALQEIATQLRIAQRIAKFILPDISGIK